MKSPADNPNWIGLNRWLDEWMALEDGKACTWHPNCLHHITHPCEGCGRQAGHKLEATQ